MAEDKSSNEIAYTPGPWFVDQDDSGLIIRMEALAGNDEYLAVYASPDKGRREADAYLIAAAPDIFEVLLEVMPDGFTIRDNFDGEAWLKKATAAIAKARGEQS